MKFLDFKLNYYIVLLDLKIFQYVKYSNKFQYLILNPIIQNIQHIQVSKHMEALKYESIRLRYYIRHIH